MRLARGTPPRHNTRALKQAITQVSSPSFKMAPFSDMLEAETSQPMLPSFKKVKHGHQGWAQGLTTNDYAQGIGSPGVVKKIVEWIDEVLSAKLTQPDMRLSEAVEGSECMMLSGDACQCKPMMFHRRAHYVRVSIGYEDEACTKHVYEYAHRLVAWARRAYNAAIPYAMHMGGGVGRRSCMGKMCVNPYHIRWGTNSNNRMHALRSKSRWKRHLNNNN